jgi:hypothetical protein
MLGPGIVCAVCGRRPATEIDHVPPLVLHQHLSGSGCCHLRPSCHDCARRQGGQLHGEGRVAEVDTPPEPAGLDPSHPAWSVPWLDELRQVPANAAWPRYMTVPAPGAVGSLGAEFAAWCEQRSGPLRWWQRLVSTRLLEHDADGELVWETLILSLARQLGKSWWLRELFLWRIHQGGRFGEEQTIMHTGKDVAICKEVQRPARMWARQRSGLYRVREVNGQEEIEHLADGSRWMVRAKDAVYGYAVSVGGVDEAWKVPAAAVEEGLVPTMPERASAQLLLVSTAHRKATALVLGRRQTALQDLEQPDGDLLVEWSAPRDVLLDDRDGWRLASPHWSWRREKLIAKRFEAALAGESDDEDEPDPVESFRAQWLNQWPVRVSKLVRGVELLLPEGAWAVRAEHVDHDSPVWVAVEDGLGLGAGVAVAARLPDGRLEVDGWLTATWDAAMVDVARLLDQRPVKGLQVGASLVDRVPAGFRPTPDRAGATEVRTGLPLLRDLVATGQLLHDVDTRSLDVEMESAKVRVGPGGLTLIPGGNPHLVRAVAWAVQSAHRRTRIPAVY